MIISCFFSTISASAANVNAEESIAMPNLGIKTNEVSLATVKEIDTIIDEMSRLSAQSNVILSNETVYALNSQNQLLTIEKQYNKLKADAQALGCTFLNEDQAMRYVYGGELPTVSTYSGVTYPKMNDIDFVVTYYQYNGNKMAKCVATQKPGTVSKMVKNYDTVEMYKDTTFSDLAKKGIQMTATKLGNYALGALTNGKVSFLVNTLAKLPGTVFPSSSSSSKAKLSLAVSTNSTVVHIWRYMNSDYYFRTASVKAAINETWVLRDTNGKHYTKTQSYTSYSSYYNDNAQAVAVTSNQSYGIYQQYKTQGLLGIYFQKQEVSPFTAALPINFAS